MGPDARGLGLLEEHLPGDAVQVVVARGGPQLAAADDEEVGGVAGGDGARRVEHQRLVGPGLDGLDEGDDLVQLGVAVEPLVEHLGSGPPHRGREQRDAGVGHRRIGHLVLGDDHHVRPADHVGGVLRRGLLVAPGDHQAQVGAVVHAVALDGGPQCGGDLPPGAADVEVYRGGAGEEPVQVPVEEGELAVVQTDPLPDTVADEEAAVEHRHLGLVTWEELVVDPDLDGGVALVGECLVGAAVHGPNLPRTGPFGPVRTRSGPVAAGEEHDAGSGEEQRRHDEQRVAVPDRHDREADCAEQEQPPTEEFGVEAHDGHPRMHHGEVPWPGSDPRTAPTRPRCPATRSGRASCRPGRCCSTPAAGRLDGESRVELVGGDHEVQQCPRR